MTNGDIPGEEGLDLIEAGLPGVDPDAAKVEAGIGGGPPRKNKDGKTLLPFRPGMFSSFGRRADTQGGTYAQNRVCAYSLEAWNQQDVRNNIPRLATNHPEYGRASQSPAGHVRHKTPFWMVPVRDFDTLVVYKWSDESGSFREVKILQPRAIKSLRRERYWALWAPNGGPFSRYGTAEKREVLRREFPYFKLRADHRFDLVQDAYEHTTDDILRAMNPELARVPNPSRLSSDELREIVGPGFTEWTYMNITAQGTFLEYQNLLIGKGAIEFGHGFDPYLDLDPHVNERHRTAISAAQKMVVDEYGIPKYVYVAVADMGQRELEEGTIEEGPTALYRNEERSEPNLKPLVDDPGAAIQRYEQVKEGYHYRFDFDPRPDVYRDLWGKRFKWRDPEHGIISDTERMAESLYFVGGKLVREDLGRISTAFGGLPSMVRNFLGGLFRRRKTREVAVEPPQPVLPWFTLGPSHSATDLLLELPAEEEVVIGKRISTGKLGSHEERAHEIGQFKFNFAETDTGKWWGGHTPGEARAILSDVLDYEVWNNWWAKFRDPGKGSIHSFTEAKITYDDLTDLRSGAPESTDFWQLCELMEFFKFDPQDCPYGYEMNPETGVCTPRLPEALLRKLVRDPSQRGVNFRGYDGWRILEQFYRTGSNRQLVRDFWLRRTSENQRQAHWRELVATHGIEYLTMAYLYWRPRDFLDLVYHNQPIEEKVKEVEEAISNAEREGKEHLRVFVDERLNGYSPEFLERLRLPRTLPTVFYDEDGNRHVRDVEYPEGYLEKWYRYSDQHFWETVVLFLSEAGASVERPSGSRGWADWGAGKKVLYQGFGTGYGTVQAQQSRRERLFELILKAGYYNVIKGEVEWWFVRKYAVELLDTKTYAHRTEVISRIAGLLSSRKLSFPYARALWAHLQTYGFIPHDDAFPWANVPESREVDWEFVTNELLMLMGNEAVPLLPEHPTDEQQRLFDLRYGINESRYMALRRGTLLARNRG